MDRKSNNNEKFIVTTKMAADYFENGTSSSLSRYQRNLDFIIQKYDKEFEKDDLVQLSSLAVIANKGCLKRSHLKCFGSTRLAATKKSDRSASIISSSSDLREQSNHLLNYSEAGKHAGNQSQLTDVNISAIPELVDPHDCDEPSDAETLGSDDSDSWDDLENSDSSKVYETDYSSSGEFSDRENSEHVQESLEDNHQLSDDNQQLSDDNQQLSDVNQQLSDVNSSLVIIDDDSFTYRLDASFDVSNKAQKRQTNVRHHRCTKPDRFSGIKSPNKERSSVADNKDAYSVENSKHKSLRKNELRATLEVDKASEVNDCNSAFTVSRRQSSYYKSLSDQNDDLTKPKWTKTKLKQCIMAPENKHKQIILTDDRYNANSEKHVGGMKDGSGQNDDSIADETILGKNVDNMHISNFSRPNISDTDHKMGTSPVQNLNLPDLVLQADASADLSKPRLPIHDETYICRNGGAKSLEDIPRGQNINWLVQKNAGKRGNTEKMADCKEKYSEIHESSEQIESDHRVLTRNYLYRKHSLNIDSTLAMKKNDEIFSKQCHYENGNLRLSCGSDTQMMGINCQSPAKLYNGPFLSPRSCEVIRQSGDSIRKQLEQLKMISPSTKSNGHKDNVNSYRTNNINICEVRSLSPHLSNMILSPKQQSEANSVRRDRSNIRTPSSIIRQLHIRSPHLDAGVVKSPQSRVQRQSNQIESCRPIAHSQVHDTLASISNMPKSNTVERNIFDRFSEYTNDACDRSHSVYQSGPVQVPKAAIDQKVIASNRIRTAWLPFNRGSTPAARNITSTPNHKISCKPRFETDMSTISSDEIEAEILESDATMILTNQTLSSLQTAGRINIQKNKLKNDTCRKDCVVKPYDCETIALASRLSKSKYRPNNLDFESNFVATENNTAFKKNIKEVISKSVNSTFTVIEVSDVKRKRSFVDKYPISKSDRSNVYDISLDSDEEFSISTASKVDEKLASSMQSKQNVSKLPIYKMDSSSIPSYTCMPNHSSLKDDKRKCRKRLDYMSSSSFDQDIKSAMLSRKRKRNRDTCPAKAVASKPETVLETSLSKTNPCLGPGQCSKSFCFTCM